MIVRVRTVSRPRNVYSRIDSDLDQIEIREDNRVKYLLFDSEMLDSSVSIMHIRRRSEVFGTEFKVRYKLRQNRNLS